MSGRIICSDGIIDYAGDIDYTQCAWDKYEDWINYRKEWKNALVTRWNSVTRNRSMLKSKYGIIIPKEKFTYSSDEVYYKALGQYVNWREHRMDWTCNRWTVQAFLKNMDWQDEN